MADLNTIQDLLEEELRDIYSAEKQLTKAIPKMMQGASDEALQNAFRSHLKETENQVTRLEQAAKILDFKPAGKKCKGMEGLIAEGSESLAGSGEEQIVDLSIIGAGSRVEHYEIAAYLSAINLAERLQADDVVDLLKQSLGEEQAADQMLRKISMDLMRSAAVAA